MKKILITTLMMASIASCQKSEEQAIEGGGSSEVTFVSGISTRATANLWDEGDKIGVFMYEAGSASAYKNSSNVEYTLNEESDKTSSGSFTSTNPLYFQQYSDVDFVAYYPYTDSAEDGAVSISTADQSSSEKFEALDFMVARATDCNETDGSPSLSFERKMSRIVITVERKASKSNAVISELTIKNIATEGTCTFDNGADNGVVPTSALLNISLFENESNQIEAIIIPQTSTSATLLMVVDGEYITASISRTFGAGMQYNYNLSIGADEVIFTAGSITDWADVENVEMESPQIKYTASDISLSSIPDSDIWVITDEGEITSELMSGVKDALTSAYSAGRRVNIILSNAKSIGDHAFTYCSGLTSIELPVATSIGDYAFHLCSKLTSIELPETTSLGDNALFGSALTSIELPNATSIGDYAFGLCETLTTLKLTAEAAITCGADILEFNNPSNITLYISQVNSNVANLTDGTYTFKDVIYND